jgi:hypothetical protein
MSGFIASAPFFPKPLMKIIRTLKPHQHWRSGGLLAADFILFGLTDAQNVNSVLLIIGYAALTITMYQIVRLLFRRRRPAVWVTGGLAAMLALQSMGGLNQRDWLVILPLIGLGYLYSAYLAKAV